MVKRICPVCDQVMERQHYCKHCRQIVKNPWVREVGYYLNERHPSNEHACSYHEDPFEADSLREKRNWTLADEQYGGGRKTVTPKQGTKAGKWILTIFLIYLAVQIVLPILFVLLQRYFWYLF